MINSMKLFMNSATMKC